MPEPTKQDGSSRRSSPTEPLGGVSPVTTPVQDPRIGKKLGKYQIIGRLGQGGMGVVYEAVDTLLQRKVAVKLLPESVANDAEALKRFLREAQAAARLSHPNVVAVHDVAQLDGTYFLVMELVTGSSMSAHLEASGPADWREATRVIADACRGLSAAHGAALIHRDIKPGNLIRSRDGHIKLADFGLAKATDRTAASLTQPGSIVGTPSFMSPEQCRCEKLDERSDIYSLGATYYALLTGKPPYVGEGPMEVMFAHCTSPVPDPRQERPELPAGCAAIVQKAMAKERGQRYSSAAEMLTDLEAVLAGAGPSLPAVPATAPAPAAATAGGSTVVVADPQRKRRLVRAAVLAGCLLAAVLVGGFGFRLLFRSGPPSASSKDKGGFAKLADSGKGDLPAGQKHVLMVLAPFGFHHPDYGPVRGVLEKGGVRVSVTSSQSPARPDFSGGGGPVTPHLLLEQARADDYDAIVICGGNGVVAYTADTVAARTLRRLIEQMHSQNKLVTALCLGPIVLADAGVLKGRQATVFKRDLPKFAGSGVEWVNEPVVVSGRIITGRDPASAEQFARTVLEALRK